MPETWYVQPNDEIGGWCVMTTDNPPSEGKGRLVADLCDEATARRIVELHTADLAGRLPPEGGETRTEWGVWWHAGDGDGIVLDEQHLASRERAEQRGRERIGEYGITRFTVHRREHRIFDDGSSYSGPWVAVDQETTDG